MIDIDYILYMIQSCNVIFEVPSSCYSFLSVKTCSKKGLSYGLSSVVDVMDMTRISFDIGPHLLYSSRVA